MSQSNSSLSKQPLGRVKLAQVEFPTLAKSDFLQALPALQLQLMKYQLGLYQNGQRVVMVFEGTDASGKGGAIKRMVNNMDPRGFRVYPIGAPTADEASRHYLQRFWRRIPHAGQISIFDRSWYGRVLVERVEGFITQEQWQRAYDEINNFEQLLVDDGIILIKLFLHIDKDEQTKRFIQRYKTPEKRWKLTMADLDSRQYWDEYQAAYQDMLDKTSPSHAPWHVIAANNKNYARIQTFQTVLTELENRIDLDVNQIELMPPEVEAKAKAVLGIE
ncbi:MAG: polyphosphate kinase 2 family protein [Pontibacterium sp.]